MGVACCDLAIVHYIVVSKKWKFGNAIMTTTLSAIPPYDSLNIIRERHFFQSGKVGFMDTRVEGDNQSNGNCKRFEFLHCNKGRLTNCGQGEFTLKIFKYGVKSYKIEFEFECVV